MNINQQKLSATKIALAIKNKDFSPLEIFDSYVRLIEKYNPVINAAVEFNFENGRSTAKKYTELLIKEKSENLPPLFGVPYTCKEMIAVKGFRRTGGNFYYKNDVQEKSATIVERIEKAGAILLATSNVPEFGFWFETNNTIYGRTSNPYNEKRTSGGSSGGEGALIGLGASPFGLGSDIGGSIRIPSAFCGIFGHKPSDYVIPISGHFPWSLDKLKLANKSNYPLTTYGPMCSHAEDLKLIFNILQGPDDFDPFCVGVKNKSALQNNLEIKKVYIISDPQFFGASQTDVEIQEAVLKTANYYEQLGAEVIELPNTIFKSALYLWSNLVRSKRNSTFGEMISPNKKLDLNKELIKLILGKSNHTLPSFVSGVIDRFSPINSDHKEKYLTELSVLKLKLNNLLDSNSILILPTQPTTAPLHNHLFLTPFNFIYCGIFNALGNPATNIPVGFDEKGLPIGVQIVTAIGNDQLSFKAAEDLQLAFGGWEQPQFEGL